MAAGKILGQAGTSLADLYDVEGSIAGVERLDSEDVHITHEMGGTILSERLVAQNFQANTGALAASVAWNINVSILGGHSRILGVQVISNQTDRVANAQLSVTTPPGGGSDDMPIFYWDQGADIEVPIRIMQNAVVGTARVLKPTMVPLLPMLLIGNEGPDGGNEGSFVISFRGSTNAFGAGTVVVTFIVYSVQPRRGLSAKGLPLPSW